MFCSYKCGFWTKHFPIFLTRNFQNENLRPRLIKNWKGKTKTNKQSRALFISCSNGQFIRIWFIEAYKLIPQAQYLENTSSHILQSMSIFFLESFCSRGCSFSKKFIFLILNPFAPGDFAEKRVLQLVEWFSGLCRAIKS